MTQETALEILKTGANVFLTGEPGSGKTYVTNEYVTWLEAAGLSVAVTASTGIARDTLSRYDLVQIITTQSISSADSTPRMYGQSY